MTVILFNIVFFLVLWHWLWESVIAPDMRLWMRNKLFACRDMLRRMAIDDKTILNDSAFKIAQDDANFLINNLHNLNIDLLFKVVVESEKQPELHTGTMQKRQCIQDAPKEIIRIFSAFERICLTSFIINSGGWFIYILPVVAALFMTGKIKRAANTVLSEHVKPNNKHGDGDCFGYS